MRFIKIVISVFLISIMVSFSNQTFEHKTAYQSKYYFLVPSTLTIVESGEPTDCYLSYSINDTVWKKTSPVYQWGLGNIYNISWVPDVVFNSGFLGLHTSPRNTKDFSVLPTDKTDTLVSVVFADATFIDPIKEYWFLDEFEFKFSYQKNTLPFSVQLQYSYDGVTWEYYQNIPIDNSGLQSFKLINDYIKDNPVKFRLTYNHIVGHVHNIAITDWVKYSPSKLNIKNKGYLERGIWDDKTPIQLKFEKVNLSNLFYHDVTVSVVVGSDTITSDILPANTTNFTFNVLNYTLTNDYTGKVEILFYAPWGELLNKLTLNYLDKYLTVANLPQIIQPLDLFYLLWSNSSNFKKISIEQSFNGGEFSKIKDSWNITSTPYPYSLIKEGLYTFKITASDEFETISTITNVISVESFMRDSLTLEIQRLNLIIDSLKTIENDSLVIVIIKDEDGNSVGQYDFKRSGIKFLDVEGSSVNLESGEFIKDVFITDYIGNVIYQTKLGSYNFSYDISSYSVGYYFLVVLTDDKNVKIYKFLK